MIEIVKVVELKPLDGYRLWLAFSNGTEGSWDLADLLQIDGPMVQPLKDKAFFDRVFIEFGVPTWPNGLALDAIALQMDIKAAGGLNPSRKSA